jgi:outer membrane receptor protein involved in Fe transport
LTFDAAAALPLTRSLAVEARAENLADARVEAGISGPGVVERATPRTLWLGLRYRLR